MITEDLRPMLLKMLSSPVRNYATPGLTSELVGGGAAGNVRYFRSDRTTRHEITPHSHRFDFVCLVIRGEVENCLFTPADDGDEFSMAMLVPKDGGLGGYTVRREADVAMLFQESRKTYRAGDTYSMQADEIHSIRFSRGAEVLFFEGPQVQATSVILEPASNGQRIETFRVEPWMFQR